MQIRFLNILAQRISSSTTTASKSTCVNFRTTQVSFSVYQQETKSDCEFFKGRTSNYNQCEKTSSDSSDLSAEISNPILKESSENHRMPVVAAVIAHRHIYPAGGASSCAGSSKRSSFASGGGGASLRLTNALNILPPPSVATAAIKKSSSGSKYSGTSGHFTGSSTKSTTTGGAVVGGGVIINGKGNRGPFVELKQLGYFLSNKVPSSAVLHESRRHYAKGKDKPKTKKSNVVINENEMGEVIDVESFKKQLNKVLEQMKEEFTTQLSIRGAAGALESLQVEFDGETYPLQELAQVGRKNPQLAVLNLASLPDAIKPVLQAIENSGMNLNPQQEGTTIYVPLPKVTREHREMLAKNAKALFMKSKVAMQAVQNKYVKQCKNHKDLSEDLVFGVQQQVMKYTDSVIVEAEKLMVMKQKELLENK